MFKMVETNKISAVTGQFAENEIPLVIDIDGTLIHTDLLIEALILLIRKKPYYFWKCILWGFKGKAYLKNKIFGLVSPDYPLLPYNVELINFIKKEFASGRKIILASASPISAVIGISKIYPIFSELYGTENKINLRGRNKLRVLTDRFGKGKFDYVGNSKADHVIFASSRYSYLVNPSRSVEKKAGRISDLRYTWHSGKATLKDYLGAIRVYQWVKNLLLFVPLVTSHSFYSVHLFMLTFGAFCTFNIMASSGYLLNDILDINSDRNHPRKRYRPVATGKISLLNASALALVFFTTGLFFASKFNPVFFYTMLFYFVTSFTYSLYLKKMAMYDVFTLAGLYSIRVFAGSEVIGVPLSFWLIAFSTFIFLSLAFLKRYSELITIKDDLALKKQDRGYVSGDIYLVRIMGIVSGFLAIVVFALYINSPEVTELYSKIEILWFVSFLLLFWINRMWMIASRGRMTDDPIVFTLKDITSYIIFLLCGLCIYAAL
jgi:4-hydroxybenzoate polyprenyltransferase